MDMRFRGADFGTLFSTAAAVPAPMHHAVRPLHDVVHGPRLRIGVRRLLDAMADRVLGWHERSRQRWLLSGLDDRMLRDLGLSRADVDGEVSKRFWQP